MAELGVGEGTVVSWQLPTRVDTVVLSMALARLGAIQNPILHLYREREVGFALRQTNSELFCVPGCGAVRTSPRWPNGALEGADRAPTLLVSTVDCPRGPRAPHPAPAASDAEGSPVRWIYYTSGSTAEPKGVRHTDQTLLAGGWGLARALR